MIISYFVLFAVILIEGFITMSVQMLTMRQLFPFTGSSVIIISLIIGVFLLFLAYGYRRGGQYSDTNASRKALIHNFTLSALFIGIGLSYTFVFYYFSIIDSVTGLGIYLLLVIAPIVYWLGQTLPITTIFFIRQKHIGEISGKVLHLSTVGSFLGSVLTTLLLINYLGVAWTVFINYCLLTLLTLLLSQRRRYGLYHLLILMVMALPVYILNITSEKNNFVVANAYGNYAILQEFDNTSKQLLKIFSVNFGLQSVINQKNQGAEYIELIKRVLFVDLKFRDKNILVLGSGGFTLSAENTYHNHFTYVDIDPSIKQTALLHFVPAINGDFIADDARSYLRNTTKKYDAIVGDTYSMLENMPFYLMTYEYFTLLKRSLAPDGVVILNLLIKPTLNDTYSRRVDNTIRAVFERCMMSPLAYQDYPVNVVYICRG